MRVEEPRITVLLRAAAAGDLLEHDGRLLHRSNQGPHLTATTRDAGIVWGLVAAGAIGRDASGRLTVAGPGGAA
jgi:hypothetical protein